MQNIKEINIFEFLKRFFAILIQLLLATYSGYSQNWVFNETETYSGFRLTALVKNTKELSTIDAVLEITKIKEGLVILVTGPQLKGAYCIAGFKFDGDDERMEFGIQSFDQGGDGWYIKSYNIELKEKYLVLIEKLKKHKYVIIRLSCTETATELKFKLDGSSEAINSVMNRRRSGYDAVEKY